MKLINWFFLKTIRFWAELAEFAMKRVLILSEPFDKRDYDEHFTNVSLLIKDSLHKILDTNFRLWIQSLKSKARAQDLRA